MKNKKQFTLIELIIVIVVIGILAAMALPKFNGVVREAKLSAMINDKEVLEKTLVLYYQKHDKLPLLNEDEELIISNEGISLTKIVLAEEVKSSDMETIYKSLKETLTYYSDSEDSLYRIDLPKIKNTLSRDVKYGHKNHDKDFYVYSNKTGNVYYYDYIVNQNGTIQHTEYDTLLRKTELTSKRISPLLNVEETIINNKPIIELTTKLEDITPNSIIDWTYTFSDEDKDPTKVSFILNEVEYNNFNEIPTKLDKGEYTIKLKMQDSKGLWSDEIIKTFKLEKSIEQEFKDIVYVKESGADTSSSGTKDNPYKTLDYALKNVKDNGSIYIEGRVNLNMILDFNNYKKNVNFIGDYKNKKSEIYIPNSDAPYGVFLTKDYKVTINGFKIVNDRTHAWGETFAQSNNITINNCIFKDSSSYSNVYGKYEFNNCVIERIGSIYSPTTFNNCVFLNANAIGSTSLGKVTVDENYNITSNHNWINAGIDKEGNKTNIGVYGGKYPWK